MLDIGRVCMKIAGRDAGKRCVILKIDGNKALVDGETRRRLVNVKHLEPMDQVLEVKEDASHDEIAHHVSEWKLWKTAGKTVKEKPVSKNVGINLENAEKRKKYFQSKKDSKKAPKVKKETKKKDSSEKKPEVSKKAAVDSKPKASPEKKEVSQ